MRFVQRVLGVVTVVSVIAAGIVVATPAAQASSGPAKDNDPGTRPDATSAAFAARSLGRPVEVLDATNETTRSWANPDGTFTDELHAAPVRARQGDKWVPIDTRLSVRDGAVKTAATAGDVTFSAGGDKALASVSKDGVEVALTWPKPLPAPTLAGNAATYGDVLPGVDLELKAVPSGYEQSFILKHRGAAKGALRVPMTARGLTAAKDGAGLVLRDAGGEDRAWIGSARMWDAQGREAQAAVDVVRTSAGRALQMTPDAAFLADPSTTFPVTVDPTVQIFRSIDTYADSGAATTNYGTNIYLKAGKQSTTSVTRSYIAFNLSAYAGKHITNVYQYFGNVDSVVCTAKTTSIYRVTAPWGSSSLTWNAQPGIDATAIASATSAAGGPTGCAANNWMTFHNQALIDLYDDWANGRVADYGLSIRTSETDTQAAKGFASGENSSWTPRVNITYNSHPGTVAGRYVTPSQIDPADNNTRHTPSTTPTLAGGACDAESEPTRVDFELYDSTATTLLQSSSLSAPTVPSCTEAQWTIPTALSNGTTYKWRSRAYDGTDYSKSWSSWVPLVVDTTAPPTAAISAATLTENAWYSSSQDLDETFTLTPSSTTDVAGYYYGLDEPNPTTYTTDSTPTIAVTEGWHTLYVQSADKAGNRSAVTSFSAGLGNVGVTSPREGARSSHLFTLSGTVNPAIDSITWTRTSGSNQYTLTQLKDLAGNTVTQPIDVSSGVVPTLIWDADAELGATGEGTFQLMAVAHPVPQVWQATRPVSVTFDRYDFGAINATEQAGPGTVNLLTGNLQVGATDVSVQSYGSDLTVGRTFNSRDADASANGPFGKGWVSSAPVLAANSEYTSITTGSGYANLTLTDGDTLWFQRETSTSSKYLPPYGYEELSMTYVSASDRFDVKDLEGNVTGFTKPTGSMKYLPTSVTQTGDSAATTYSYETVTVNGQSVTRVTGVMAPQPSGLSGTCSLTSPSAVVGCRSLKLTYFASTTTPPTGTNTGAYPHRLQKVELIAYDPDLSTPAMRTLSLAEYAYDANGRLAQAWDPRASTLRTTYTYNTNGQLATVTPPSEQPWTIAYAALSTEASTSGRVKSISRPTLLTSPAPTTATTTFVYRVPVSGSGAPHDLSSAELARWGQQDAPASGTAVFPPTTEATFGTGSLPVPSSYDRATVHYLNVDGREVNTADPHGGIDVTEHDARGNVVRALTAANRQRALDQGSSSSAEAAIAQVLSSLTVYANDGIDVLETFGPEHSIRLSTGGDPVRARAHTVNTYDELTLNGPHHLLTTSVTSARVAGESTDRSTESRTTKTSYGNGGGAWVLGLPRETRVDPGGLNLVTRTSYTGDGRVLTQTLPSGGHATDTPATRVTRYYSAGADTVDAACGNQPEWANLVCSVSPGGQPSGVALPTTYMTYDMFNRPRVVTEKSGSTVLRTTTTTYDSAGRPSTVTVTGSTGDAVKVVETAYDSNGRAYQTRAKTGSTVDASVTRDINSLGQVTGYTDADGTGSTTTYDVVGRPVTTDDGKGTQTWTYDSTTERRGLATQLVDSHAGTFTATYDAAGTPTITWPNGLQSTTTVDETGTPTSLTYAATSGCSGSACVVYTESVTESIHGETLDRASTQSSQKYTYDAPGRLTQVDDTVGLACTVRRYTLDAGGAGNGNRTKLEEFGSSGACQTSSATTTVNSTYDTADRITTSGVVYDALGRTTTVPDADVLGSGALTVAYHVNDIVRSIAIAGGVTKTYTLDVNQQRVRSWTDGTTTRTNHYDGDSDNPSWTQEGSTAWSRNITGIAGDLAAIYAHDGSTGAATLQLTNLHGDVVATVPTSSMSLTMFESTEFGIPRGSTGTRYAWLGGKQRAADTPGGLTIMGVRLYNPATGRFLQVDPVYGGNDNAYAYPNDPINDFDLDGRFGFKKWLKRAARVAQFIPGPIGTVANVAWGTYYAATGQYGKAAASFAGAASFGVARYTSLVGRFAQRSRYVGKASKLFGRGKVGLFNRNDVARLGWSWRGSAQNGSNVFRAVVGSKRNRFGIHLHYTMMRGID